jgi:hypothetical protein
MLDMKVGDLRRLVRCLSINRDDGQAACSTLPPWLGTTTDPQITIKNKIDPTGCASCNLTRHNRYIQYTVLKSLSSIRYYVLRTFLNSKVFTSEV